MDQDQGVRVEVPRVLNRRTGVSLVDVTRSPLLSRAICLGSNSRFVYLDIDVLISLGFNNQLLQALRTLPLPSYSQ
jgi:hypothetical protein